MSWSTYLENDRWYCTSCACLVQPLECKSSGLPVIRMLWNIQRAATPSQLLNLRTNKPGTFQATLVSNLCCYNVRLRSSIAMILMANSHNCPNLHPWCWFRHTISMQQFSGFSTKDNRGIVVPVVFPNTPKQGSPFSGNNRLAAVH